MFRAFIFSLFFLLPGSASAFFVGLGVERTEKKVFIDVQDPDSVFIEVHEYLTNTSSEDQSVTFFEPFHPSVSDISFFVDSEGGHFDVLKRNRLETIFHMAQKYQDHHLFGLASPPFSSLLSASITVPSGQTIHTKVSFTQHPDFIDGMFLSEVFLTDGIPTPDFELSLTFSHSQDVQHFLSNAGEKALGDISSEKRTLLWQEKDFVPSENFQFFWSHQNSPTLSYPFLDHTYTAHFLPLPEPHNIRSVTFLIDRSGSLLGSPWSRLEEWMRFLLEEFGEGVKVKIAFFTEDLEWYSEEFAHNGFEFQKDFFHFFTRVQPVGRTDLSGTIKTLGALSSKELGDAVVLITDSDIPSLPSKFPSPLLTLSFGGQEGGNIDLLSQISGGFFLRLFQSSVLFLERDMWQQKWINFRAPLGALPGRLPLTLQDFSTKNTPFFMARTEASKTPFSPSASFLPQNWAARRIAEIFKKMSFDDGDIDALLSIGRVFGIETSFFEGSTGRKTLQKILRKEESSPHITGQRSPSLWKEILRLEGPDSDFSSSNIQFVGAKPFYRDGKAWRAINFLDTSSPHGLIEVAPFSEAQKELFLRLSKELSPFFRLGKTVDFCLNLRCVSVREGFRMNSVPSDYAFWKNDFRDHWAQDLLFRGVRDRIIHPMGEGDIYPDQVLSRGAFLTMAWRAFRDDFLASSPQDISFSDLSSDHIFHDGIRFFAEKGIVRGYEDGTFRPDQDITRAEALKVLLSMTKYSPNETEGPLFPDSIGWEKGWVNEGKRRGWVSGYEDGAFRPHQGVSRAEALKLIYKLKD